MNGKPWTTEETEKLKSIFSDLRSEQVAEILGRSYSSVVGQAAKLGLHKSLTYLASPAACRLRRGEHVGKAFQFKKGQIPANKGLRRPGWSPGRMASTQFKPGNKSHTWLPVGSKRVSKDGYLQTKISDTGYSPRDWKSDHSLLWEKHHGDIPRGHVVVFRDGKKANIVIENLEMISRRELMMRNTVQNLPRDLVQVIQLRGALKRKIKTKMRKQENGTQLTERP